MGAYHDLIQRAVVLGVAVVSAGPDGALDALVGIAVHVMFLLCFGFAFSMPAGTKKMYRKRGYFFFIFVRGYK